MKVIEGHLTVKDREAVKALLAIGEMEGKIGKASYRITGENGHYMIEKFIKDRGLVPVPGSALRLSKYVSKIKM